MQLDFKSALDGFDSHRDQNYVYHSFNFVCPLGCRLRVSEQLGGSKQEQEHVCSAPPYNNIYICVMEICVLALICKNHLQWFEMSILWLFINAIAHGTVDYVTSRVTSALWKKGDVHNFFVVIGFDQLLHVAILIYTAAALLPVEIT